MRRNSRLLLVSLGLAVLAGGVLGLKLGYPRHRLFAALLWLAGWVPLAISYHINRRLVRTGKVILKRKAKPYLPHAIVGGLLLAVFYVAWVLVPVETSPLVRMTDGELRQELAEDLQAYRMLRGAADDLTQQFEAGGLLGRDVASLRAEERLLIRRLWRDGVMAFLEADMLKEKYRGFFQIDYQVKPALHADAFFIAYGAYVIQYEACLRLCGLTAGNALMEAMRTSPVTAFRPTPSLS